MVDDHHVGYKLWVFVMVKISATAFIDKDALKAKIGRAADPAVKAGLMNAGKEMVNVANSLMAAEFNLNRPFERRRHPGSRRAATALDFTVTGSAGDYQLGFRVLGGEEVFKRILGMNYGIPAHQIVPSGAWSLKGMRPPSGRSSIARLRMGGGVRGGANQPLLAWVDGDTGEDVVTTEVWWYSKTPPPGFLEEARDAIVARAGSFF